MLHRKCKGWTISLLLVSLAGLALSCGPASPSERGAATQADTTAPAETATVPPTDTIQPTATPYPPGYVKPTDLPTWTPFSTLPPDPPTPEPAVPSQLSPGTSSPKPSSPGPTLAEQVTEYVEVERDYYDAIVRVTARSQRDVVVPHASDESKWPPMQSPQLSNWRRTGITIAGTYKGELPDDYEMISPFEWIKNGELDVGEEYILFVRREWVRKGEFPDEKDQRSRFHFDKEQLDAVGGRGAVFLGDQAWIVDGDTAWRIPQKHIVEGPPGSDMAAAQAGGESMPVGELVAAIKAATVGMYFGLSETDRTIAQEGSTDFPYPDKVVTPITPVPTVDRTKRPLIIEYVPSSGPPVERMEAKTDAGSSTKPATGNYLYLPKIGRYYSLPDDVKRVERIDLGTCIPETPCPDFPLLIYQRGEAFIGIDQAGEIFEDVGNGDASAFPFFTGQEETEDK